MDMSNDGSLVFEIIGPIISFIILTICCVGCCRGFQQAHKERKERVQAELQRVRDQAPVYVIPISRSEDELHRPPHYSTVHLYEPPPAYHELNLKPEACPVDPPPAYSPSPSHS